jgi:glycosyltransferase involved in cell wall biosynthesis
MSFTNSTGHKKYPKILYIVPSWFTVINNLRGQLAFLKSNGFNVELVCEADPRADEAASREGVRYFPINIFRSINPIQDVITLTKLIRVIKEGKYDIITCSSKKGGFLGSLAGKWVGNIGIVYVIHGLFTEKVSPLKQPILNLIDNYVCKLADRVVCMSSSNMEFLLKRKLCPYHKMVIFGEGSLNGIDTAVFKRTKETKIQRDTLRQELGIAQDAYVFGFVGRLVKEKGIKELADAWIPLRNRFKNIHLLLIGPPEIDPNLVPVLGILQKDPTVHFAGFMSDPRLGYAAMDCLLLPSHAEGFPNTILEAGAMELPVIACRVLGCVDAVVHEQTGLLVEPRDYQALGQAMARVLLNQSEAREWGMNARQRCLRYFQQETIWRGYADLYIKLFDSNQKYLSSITSEEMLGGIIVGTSSSHRS